MGEIPQHGAAEGEINAYGSSSQCAGGPEFWNATMHAIRVVTEAHRRHKEYR